MLHSSPRPLNDAPLPQRDPNEQCCYGAPLGTHQYPPIPGVAENIEHRLKNQTLQANINIASLNINGFAAPTKNITSIKKWSSVFQTMKTNKTAILALQETHLDNEHTQSINECFEKRITVINTQHPTNPRGSAGTAFVINRALIVPKNMTTIELIQGRAIAIRFNWHENKELLLINVYAPNGKQEQLKFWEDLDTSRRANGLRRPDILLGDFNVTEDAIDRAPAHLDDVNVIEALRNLHQCLGLKDAWHHTFPNERNFTYRVNNNGQQVKSRIDRIYLSDTVAKTSFDWKLKQMSVPMDHWMVQVKYAPAQAPFIGKEHWTWQLPELKNVELMEKIQVRGMELQRDLRKLAKELTPCEIKNPQTLWAEFKSYLRNTARKHCKETRGKISKKNRKTRKRYKNDERQPRTRHSQ